MSARLISEDAFRKRVFYSGDFKRVQPFEQVCIDLDVKPAIGYENFEYLNNLAVTDTFPNEETRTLFDRYLIDLIIFYTAYRSYPVIFRHLNNAGVTKSGASPASLEQMQRAQDFYIQLANGVFEAMMTYYCKYSNLIDLPKTLNRYNHAPYTGANLNIDFAVDDQDIDYKVVPLIPFGGNSLVAFNGNNLIAFSGDNLIAFQ